MVTDIRQMTVEEYLAYDEGCEFTNEYIDGEIIPMAGGTRKHNAIVAHTIAELVNALGDSECAVFASQMRVRIDASKYVFPDVSVVCGNPVFEDKNEVILRNPSLVVEVTSPSSLAHDHVDKVAYYGAVPSIQGYLILDQDRVFAEMYTRAESGWHLQQFSSLDDAIALKPLACSLSLAQVYRGIVFDK